LHIYIYIHIKLKFPSFTAIGRSAFAFAGLAGAAEKEETWVEKSAMAPSQTGVYQVTHEAPQVQALLPQACETGIPLVLQGDQHLHPPPQWVVTATLTWIGWCSIQKEVVVSKR